MPWESITDFCRFLEAREKPIKIRDLRELFAASCGFISALRSLGIGAGNGQFHDACYAQMEICRHAKEVFNTDLAAWWVTKPKG